jgi:hypothetical protein
MTSKRGNGGGAVDQADINGVLAHFELIFELLAQPHSRNLVFFGHGEPAPTSAPSTECLLLLSYERTSIELVFGFTLVTNSVRNKSHL